MYKVVVSCLVQAVGPELILVFRQSARESIITLMDWLELLSVRPAVTFLHKEEVKCCQLILLGV